MQPELKRFMDKRISLKLNAHRHVTGRLRGFDHFMNVVLDDAIEEVSAIEKREIGLIVSVTNVSSMAVKLWESRTIAEWFIWFAIALVWSRRADYSRKQHRAD
jgi:small nuclear ribonucleoprotein G